ncbi:hypothetical protein HYW83_02025 [Candidatus Peregrinibacteria bacterium]|nr:hypothetical protein [Candidatus Peregrinibacteria bacterium]
MGTAPFENREHGREQREVSIFERPREPWDEKSAVQEYARRSRAHWVGRVLLGAEIHQEEEQGGREKPKNLQRAFRENEVALEGLHGKKLALEKTRADFAKRFEDFRQAQKVMGYALEPFTGEKRDILFEALNDKLNPASKEAPSEGDQRKFGEALAQLDARTAPDQQQGMHVAAYMYLKQERVFAAEDQLNGTREQALQRESQLVNAEGTVVQFLESQPDLAHSLARIVRDKKRTDEQKLRAIDATLEGVRDPKQREAIEGYIKALIGYATEMPALEKRIKSGELSLNRENEGIQNGPRLAELEQAIDQLPDDAVTHRQKESIERHDVI